MIELRENITGEGLTLRGYFSVFGHTYRVGTFREKFARGAFASTLSDPNTTIVALLNHTGLPLASTRSVDGRPPTLRCEETERGLFAEALLDPRNSRTQDLQSTAEWSGIEGSLAFLCEDDSWDGDQRTIKRVAMDKGDISAVTFGASDATEVGVSARESLTLAETRAALRGVWERRTLHLPDTFDLRRDFSQKERDEAAASGAALPDGSFPILNATDLKAAIASYGRAKDAVSAKLHIIKRARALGLGSLLPEAWGITRAAEANQPRCRTCGGFVSCTNCEGNGEPVIPNGSSTTDGRSVGPLNDYRSRLVTIRERVAEKDAGRLAK